MRAWRSNACFSDFRVFLEEDTRKVTENVFKGGEQQHRLIPHQVFN